MNKLDVEKCRSRNDGVRANSDYLVERSVMDLPDLAGLFKAIREYSSFDDESDPEDEHSCGRIEWNSVLTYWEIEYYDRINDCYSDALDPDCEAMLRVSRVTDPSR